MAPQYHLLASLRRGGEGLPISDMDAQIAAIVRSRGMALATRNVRDFNGTGINVIDPWTPEPFPAGKRVIAWQISIGRDALPWRACRASAAVRGFFRGTRTPVSLVFDNLQDMSIDELVE